MNENKDEEVDEAGLQAMLEKILANNPGNFVRKKAITVDMTEFESLRRQLEHNHAE